MTPIECVKDGKSTVRWIRAHATELGVDPKRIAAGGGSAGGHVAACCGVIDDLDEAGEDSKVSSKPNALCLFNPVLVLAEVPALDEKTAERLNRLKRRFKRFDPKIISPYHHVSKDDPPTIIFHGEADTVVPFPTARLFAEAMRKLGCRCELVPYPGKNHGFFNFGRGEEFYDTLKRTDKFLASLGYLAGKPEVEKFRQSVKAKRGR